MLKLNKGKLFFQTSWFFITQFIGKAISFFYILFLARSLTVEDFGLFTTALAYFSIVSVVSEFGLNRYLIREVVSNHLSIPNLLCNISILRLSVTSLLFGILALVLSFTDPDKLRVNLVLLSILAILPQSVAQILDAIFVASSKMHFSAAALLFMNIVTVIFGVWLVEMNFGSFGAISGLILGQVCYFAFLLIVFKMQKFSFLSVVTFSSLRKVIKESAPYGFLGIIGLLYFRVDTILLSYLRGNFDTGIYGAAYKFLEAVTFIPSIVAAGLFPIFAKLQNTNISQLKKIYYLSIKAMSLVSFLVVLFYLIFLPIIITNFLPSYVLAIPVVTILTLSIPFMFIHAPAVLILLSTDKYLNSVIKLSLLILLFNIILNLLFIPKYGYFAAAWITLISEVLSFLLFFKMVRKHYLT